MEAYCSIILNNVTAQQAGDLLLDQISFTLHAGEHLAIFGASGSGKSLLAQALKGSLPHTGSIGYKRAGRPVHPVIAYIPAAHPLKNHTASTGDVVTLTGALLKKGKAAEVAQWLERFQLTRQAHTPLTRLSYGELKKMQVIGHLLTHPEILILDRVFTGLDVKSRKVLHTVINQLSTEGVTIILITDRHELPASITHFVEMSEGAVINYAPVEKLGFMTSLLPREPDAPLPLLKKAYHIGPLIAMKQVNIRSGNNLLLNNINWQVNNGECWLIKGHNGAGKSTLLSLINGDNPQAYTQQISLFGRKRGSGESVWDIKRRIGFVSPELQLFFDRDISVFQAVGSGFFDTIGLFRKLDETQTQKVQEWLSFFSLQDKAHHPMTALSGGEQRLVLIARALIKAPLMLALDGPCQGLDDNQSRMVVRLLERIHAETGMTLLFVSHYEDEVPSCVKHIMELENGHPTLYKKVARPAFAASKKYTLTHRVS
ncbi:ATP-binding cassette domain-containing protein [Niabella drilacis]|uniref:Molybdate transport system ATP-binding protein n=1 Tax=Niabella drilacis (strain DSM 25811 / CCM 8410 / CCUG 62505 / LMG 26954 / E90) TaxID=1285928 RepID=A0A1G6SZW7_NIADE|nr:ATP-binding cassette domain-containing protein [Niabella drilacis]SDD22313.1 molybdate transport system ATP-binding protein [Niabella drilacis]